MSAALLLSACSLEKRAPEWPNALAQRVLEGSGLDALLAMDEAESEPAITACFFVVLRDRERPTRMRARAAAALLRQGYDEGLDHCMAVLGAGLPAFADREARHGLPISDRWAFPRELCAAALRAHFASRQSQMPAFDVNFGAPQLEAAVRAIDAALTKVNPPRPRWSSATVDAVTPLAAPFGIDADTWNQARVAALQRKR